MEPTNLGQLFDEALTADEWWAEFNANACCPSPHVAALRLCGCGGSTQFPAGASRLLFTHSEETP